MNKKSAAVMSWRVRTKRKLIDYKGGQCEKCGYRTEVNAVYHFHHLDSSLKEFSIASRSVSYDRLKDEADKCSLLCSNCHAEVHWEQSQESRVRYRSVSRISSGKPKTISSCPTCLEDFQQKRSDHKYCCLECSRKGSRKVQRPDDETLLQEVAELGWKGTGKKYGVTDNAVKKWLKVL